jgi:hypothetical protein
MSDPLEDAFVDLAMLVIGATVLTVGVLAVAIFRAVAGAVHPELEPDEYHLKEEELPW